MEGQLMQLLSAAQSPQDGPRKAAEQQLLTSFGHPDLPPSLIRLASNDAAPLNIRQAALYYLKNLVLAGWSEDMAGFNGTVFVTDANKELLRPQLLELATSDQLDGKLRAAAGLVVSKIAAADYPEQWPGLLESLLDKIPSATDGQLHGGLKVLSELVEESFSEDTFFGVAKQLVSVLYNVAINEQRKPVLRALACSVFRQSLDTLEMILEQHKDDVTAFANDILTNWMPFFISILKMRLPEPPSMQEEEAESPPPNAEMFKGVVAFKLQAVKTLMRVITIFPSIVTPHTLVLFQVTWEELNLLQPAYHLFYVQQERQSRLEDADSLPYTLDFLVLEELDFMQACLRSREVRAQLNNGAVNDVIRLAVAYARITTEEQGMWECDVNLFLSEETNVTANYTPRTACGDLIIKLGHWLKDATVSELLSYTRALFSQADWRSKEAALYILHQLLGELYDLESTVSTDAAHGFVESIRYAAQQPDHFLRARGYLVAGSLSRTCADNTLQQVASAFLNTSLQVIANDPEEVVQVSCIRAVQFYLQGLPLDVKQSVQMSIIHAITGYLSAQDRETMAESDDLMITLAETLRDVILVDTRICIEANALDTLFSKSCHLPLLVTTTAGAHTIESDKDLVYTRTYNTSHSRLSSPTISSLICAVQIIMSLSFMSPRGCKSLSYFESTSWTLSHAFRPLLRTLLTWPPDVASYQVNNYQLSLMVIEAFENVTINLVVMGGDAYERLCKGVLPSLTAAFDVGDLTKDDALCSLAAELLSTLAEHGPEPLPPGFVLMTMPKLQRVLSDSRSDEELVKSATTAVKNILSHDHQQLFAWRDDTNKGGLEVLLMIVSHLLSSCSEHAAGEVGALAAELVEKAGHERLGPHLEGLLLSVAVRLSTAEHVSFIQSLTLVFARLSWNHAAEIVEFLARQDIHGQNALQLIMAKWLENCINFAGYDEIRQNVIALSKLYELQDARLAQVQVKGDLMASTDTRIMTRSRAKDNPDKWTTVSANIKILKVLTLELQSAAAGPRQTAGLDDLPEADEGGDWEDEPNPFMDLASGLSKEQLMQFAAEEVPGRDPDNETQDYLVDFFHRVQSQVGMGDFTQLNDTEQSRLSAILA